MSRPDRHALARQFEAVRRVLFEDWNPVGIDGLPEDEYDDYVWPIVRMLREGASETTLAQHLHDVELFYFSRDTPAEKLMPVAFRLRALGIEREPS